MGDPVHAYALEREDGSWDGVVTRFFANYVCYARDDDFDAEAMASLIAADGGLAHFGSINGKYSTVARLAPYFYDLTLMSLDMAVCTRVRTQDVAPAPDGTTIRPLTHGDYEELFSLLGSIEQYAGLYDDARSIALAKQQRAADEAHGCVTYGAFYEGRLVSTAATSAASSRSAMVVSVGTERGCRGNGLASAVVARLCEDALADGKEFLTLFYDNPEAGAIYRRIGFRNCGRYAMLR